MESTEISPRPSINIEANGSHYQNVSNFANRSIVNGGKSIAPESTVQPNRVSRSAAPQRNVPNGHGRPPTVRSNSAAFDRNLQHGVTKPQLNNTKVDNPSKKRRRCCTIGTVTLILGGCNVVIGVILLSLGRATPSVFPSSSVSDIGGPILISGGVLIAIISFKCFYDACHRDVQKKKVTKGQRLGVPNHHIRTVSGQLRNSPGAAVVTAKNPSASMRILAIDPDMVQAREISSNSAQQRRYIVSSMKSAPSNRVYHNKTGSGQYSHHKRIAAAASHQTSRRLREKTQSLDYEDYSGTLDVPHVQVGLNSGLPHAKPRRPHYEQPILDPIHDPANVSSYQQYGRSRHQQQLVSSKKNYEIGSKQSLASSRVSSVSTPKYINFMMFPENLSKHVDLDGVAANSSAPSSVAHTPRSSTHNKMISPPVEPLSGEFLNAFQQEPFLSDNTSSQISFAFDNDYAPDEHKPMPPEKCLSLQDILHIEEFSPKLLHSQRVFSLDNGQAPFFSHQIERQYQQVQPGSGGVEASPVVRHTYHSPSPKVSYQTEI